MKKLWNIYQNKKRIILPIVGVWAVSLIGVLYVLLGEGSYVEVHDQMDGEILNYIYQAKYLFLGDVIPEFMNGMDKSSMTPPAPFGVLLYKVFPPYAAFVVMQWMIVLIGFLGMYYLCRHFELPEEICFLAGGLFAYMPFYPVYGLAALGQPMLVLCYLRWLKGEGKPWYLLGICFYGLMSSLTLVGFAWLMLGGIHLVVLLFGQDWKKVGRNVLAILVLLLTYVVTNLDLLRSVLGDGFQTHREEMVLQPTADLYEKFKELLFQGGAYSKTYSLLVFWGALLLCCIGLIRKNEESIRRAKRLGALVAGIVVLTLWAVLWNAGPVVSLRESIGGMAAYFQADRVYWIFPFLWIVALGFLLEFILFMIEQYKDVPVKAVLWGIMIVLVTYHGASVFQDSTLNKNIRLLLVDGYEQVTWESFYMEDVFAEIDAVISPDKDSYSVVSLGMYPSIALYNGFACADGYSNNYDLDYKHAFREIISAELEKSRAVRTYFDDWGNRCYLATAQRGFDAMVKKGSGFAYTKPSYSLAEMEKFNIRYLFSAAPIEDAIYESMLVEGSPFSTESSYYEVWVYDLQK